MTGRAQLTADEVHRLFGEAAAIYLPASATAVLLPELASSKHTVQDHFGEGPLRAPGGLPPTTTTADSDAGSDGEGEGVTGDPAAPGAPKFTPNARMQRVLDDSTAALHAARLKAFLLAVGAQTEEASASAAAPTAPHRPSRLLPPGLHEAMTRMEDAKATAATPAPVAVARPLPQSPHALQTAQFRFGGSHVALTAPRMDPLEERLLQKAAAAAAAAEAEAEAAEDAEEDDAGLAMLYDDGDPAAITARAVESRAAVAAAARAAAALESSLGDADIIARGRRETAAVVARKASATRELLQRRRAEAAAAESAAAADAAQAALAAASRESLARAAAAVMAEARTSTELRTEAADRRQRFESSRSRLAACLPYYRNKWLEANLGRLVREEQAAAADRRAAEHAAIAEAESAAIAAAAASRAAAAAARLSDLPPPRPHPDAAAAAAALAAASAAVMAATAETRRESHPTRLLASELRSLQRRQSAAERTAWDVAQKERAAWLVATGALSQASPPVAAAGALTRRASDLGQRSPPREYGPAAGAQRKAAREAAKARL